VLFDATSQLASYREQADFELRGAPFPRFAGRDPQLATGGNTLFAFSEDEARREAAWRFMRFLLSPASVELWIRETGYLPTRDGVRVPDDAVTQVAVDQLPLVVPWVSFPGPNGLQASQALYDAQQAALGGESSAEEALGRAAEEVNGLIEDQPCPS
jgi:multiple sugar transport system substrate-binding protein